MFDYDDGYGDDDYDEDEELHIIAMTEMHMHTMSGDCHCKPERVDNSYVHLRGLTTATFTRSLV
jgi:hypothetical protein